MRDHPDPGHDPADDAILAALDRLGQAERHEPSDGFEPRLAAATRPGVAGSIGAKPSPLAAPFFAPASWVLAAACVGLTVTGLFLLRQKPTQTPGPAVSLAAIEADIDDLLFIDALADNAAVLQPDNALDPTLDDQPADQFLLDVLGLDGGAS